VELPFDLAVLREQVPRVGERQRRGVVAREQHGHHLVAQLLVVDLGRASLAGLQE
jgi:hypothetical protein